MGDGSAELPALELKRLVARGVFTEDQPGLFALAPTTAEAINATRAPPGIS
jgi:hypothetical protein